MDQQTLAVQTTAVQERQTSIAVESLETKVTRVSDIISTSEDKCKNVEEKFSQKIEALQNNQRGILEMKNHLFYQATKLKITKTKT